MAPRKKKQRRARRSFSLINAAESFGYLSIMTNNLFDASVMEFFTGPENLTDERSGLSGTQVQTYFLNNPTKGAIYGANPLSLRDVLEDPGFAANAIIGRGRANAVKMVFEAATLNIGFKLFKRALRAPIANINRNLVKPALGAGVRL